MEATISKPQSSSTTTTTTSTLTLTSSSARSSARSSSQEEDLLARLAKLSDGIQTSQHNVQSLSSADEGSGGKPMNLQDMKHVKAECDNKKSTQPAAIQATAPAENSLIARIKAAQAAKEKKPSPPPPPPPPAPAPAPAPAPSALTAPAPALAPDLLSKPAPSVQEPPPPFPTHVVAPPHE
eukprot:CAMPEP_0182498752 /NCGR_PEP_ID=MMETSP1321-20130603/6851_1 /TAXON_ID=91990 /ORGANISM="Bolidomonas sp., Strain RCC1657" /LENGTH=180 /DNA_ID=CAMNT_0024702849 /DNA_START=10 /DNA_END=549 /DNA_ORIENTATION=-